VLREFDLDGALARVYLPDQAERAVQNFFRKGNLIALRELALRRTADRVDDQMESYRLEAGGPARSARESLLVCVGPGTGARGPIATAAGATRQAESGSRHRAVVLRP
jgi:two-component system sensor histidine kinase KdpD